MINKSFFQCSCNGIHFALFGRFDKGKSWVTMRRKVKGLTAVSVISVSGQYKRQTQSLFIDTVKARQPYYRRYSLSINIFGSKVFLFSDYIKLLKPHNYL